MSTQPNTLLTPEEYLAIEREAEYKSPTVLGSSLRWVGLDDVLVIESVGCSLKLADLYEKVEL